MKAKKVISIYAKADLSEASKWYEKQQKGLGKRFLKEVRDAIDAISKNPTACQIRYDEQRIYYTSVFPYGIHYQYVSSDNEVRIKAIFHTARNPRVWKRNF